MVKPITPGVYIDEATGPGAIEGVPTWGVAFLSQNDPSLPAVPTLVTSKNDFDARFGVPGWRSYLHWAVRQFFDAGGMYCWILRVTNTNDNALSSKLTFTRTDSKNQTDYTTTLKAATTGTWGNLLWIGIGEGPTVLTGFTSVTVCVRDDDVNPANEKSWNETDVPSSADRKWIWSFLMANSSIKAEAKDLTASGGGKADKVYVLENFPSLVASDIVTVCNTISQNSMFLRCATTELETPPTPISDVIENGWYALGGGVKGTNHPSGNNATIAVTAGHDSTITNADYVTACEALAGVQGVSTIVSPDIVVITDADSTLTKQLSIARSLAAECEKAGRDWFYVVDPPFSLSAQDTVNFKSGSYGGATDNAVVSSYAALYWPCLNAIHPKTGQLVATPPSGAVVGRFVNTDLNVGVHQAAAGVNFGALSTVPSLDVASPITDAVQNVVYPDGLNIIRNRINYGICIWGCRTLSYDVNWKYIPVRRLFNYVEKSLVEGLQQFIFDVNNVHLWVRVTREITAFLVELWQSGALFGRTQDEAFLVTCDESNNTQATMQEGYLYVKVEIRPVDPAEFIVIQLSQKMASA